MRRTESPILTNTARPQLWLWPNLLSLDAPLVALAWQVLFVRCFHAHLETSAVLLLGMAVWLIYSGDRMLDAWRGAISSARHAFYREHWARVLPVWLAVLSAGLWVASRSLTGELWMRGALVAGLSGVYLGLVHGVPSSVKRAKELAVGAVFALGVSVVVWPMVRSSADVLAIVLFFLLCWANCIAIEDWERGRAARGALWWIAGAVAVMAVLSLRELRSVLGAAEISAALGLVLLDRWRERLSPDALRVLADVALLSPLLFLQVAGTVV